MKCFNKSEYGPLILRLVFGLSFLVIGIDKILSMTAAKEMFTGWFGSAGLVLLYVAIAVELIGGLCLLFNWNTRTASLLLTVLLVVAFVKTFRFAEAAHTIGMIKQLAMNIHVPYVVGLLALAFLSGPHKKSKVSIRKPAKKVKKKKTKKRKR